MKLLRKMRKIQEKTATFVFFPFCSFRPLIPVGVINEKARISVWPATSRDTYSAKLTTSDSWKKIARDQSAKPTFLIQLERYLDLTLPAASQNNLASMFKVYQKCFELFIIEFQIYKPLLTQIKLNYENILIKYQDIANTVPNLEKTIESMKLKHVKKIEKIKKDYDDVKSDEKIKLNELKEKFQKLELELRNSYQEQARLKAENEKYTSEYEDIFKSRNTLYESIKHYQYSDIDKQEKITKLMKTIVEKAKIYDHCVIAKAAAMEENFCLKQAIQKLPTSDKHERVTEKLAAMEQKLSEQKAVHKHLMEDHMQILNLYENVTEKRKIEQIKEETLGGSQREMTPRPDWSKAFDQDFLDDQSIIIESTSTSDLVGRLLMDIQYMKDKMSNLPPEQKELLEKNDETDDLYFEAKSEPDTPKYLRYRGKLRNRRIAKRDTERFIHKVWQKKYSRLDHERMPLEEYLYFYLLGEFGIQSCIAEWGYNLLDSLERYSYDADCELFLKILTGELPEAIYRDQQEMLRHFHEELIKLDKKSTQNKVSGNLNRNDLLDLLTNIFPNKDEIEFKELKRALIANEPREVVRYGGLFEEDREGNQGPFIECVRDQHTLAMQDFQSDIKMGLESLANEYHAISLENIRNIIKTLDPLKPESEINHYITTGFGVRMIEVLTDDMQLEVTKFMNKLCREVLVKRTGPKRDDLQISDCFTPTPNLLNGDENMKQTTLISSEEIDK